jgi:hypothetical protein
MRNDNGSAKQQCLGAGAFLRIIEAPIAKQDAADGDFVAWL